MKFLDIFAGIGGFRLGMEGAGHESVGYVEWDKYARKSYEAIFGTRKEWTAHDINDVGANEIPKADVWCFGFPCTDLSIQGERAGLQGRKSGLFYRVMQLVADQKRENKPRYLFIENVENLLRINRGWDFARLIFELDEAGYDAEWQVLDSSEFGVAQQRKRVYIVGHLRGKSTRKVFPLIGKTSKVPIKVVGRVEQGGHDLRKRVYDPEGVSCTLTAVQGGGHEPKILTKSGLVRKLTPREMWRLQGFPDWAFEKAAEVNSNSQLYKQAGNSVTVNVIREIGKVMD